jgi:D-alanyl-D-alanine carboxypeptidase/D-alanyl-D-alanine-endopeptidase (penicillin-binding protein 4)
MYKFLLITIFSIIATNTFSQKWLEPMQVAISKLEKDANMQHGIISFTVMDANTGEIVFEKNSELGLPTASTQKVITAICAYELLGANYQYETKFYVNAAKNCLQIEGSYDPTLGSWRYASTKPEPIVDSIIKGLAKFGGNTKPFGLIHNNKPSDKNKISDGWIYEDLANYYGAECSPFNWRENKFEAIFTPTTIGQKAKFENVFPPFIGSSVNIINTIITAKDGMGDNTCAYNIPQNNKFIYYNYKLAGELGLDVPKLEAGISIDGITYICAELMNTKNKYYLDNHYQTIKNSKEYLIYKHRSPTLDSINYWFLKKSINLYGESLLRTMAMKKFGDADYEKGIQYIHSICKQLKLDSHSVHIFDGCGLSPQNRVTTKALATFMQYARGKDYYQHFYNCLPIINDISMKSGSIHGARAYTGYINSSDEHVYTFAIAVNNYDGSGKEMQTKLWKLLDVLK